LLASAAVARFSPARQRAVPAVVAVAGALACVVLAAFDPRRESVYPACPFRAVTGRACAGCGVTRGLHELLTGHPLAALKLNLLLAVLIPGSLYAYLAWALPRWGGPKLWRPAVTSRVIVAGIAVIVLWTALRNLPWAPFRDFSSLS
jgi:hypothetical protein